MGTKSELEWLVCWTSPRKRHCYCRHLTATGWRKLSIHLQFYLEFLFNEAMMVQHKHADSSNHWLTVVIFPPDSLISDAYTLSPILSYFHLLASAPLFSQRPKTIYCPIAKKVQSSFKAHKASACPLTVSPVPIFRPTDVYLHNQIGLEGIMMRRSYESFIEPSLSLVCISCRASPISLLPLTSSCTFLQLPLIVLSICI